MLDILNFPKTNIIPEVWMEVGQWLTAINEAGGEEFC
jgi:hypothetical protein